MTSQPVTVEISFWVPPDDLIPETEVPDRFAADPEQFEFLDSQIASLLIAHADTELRLTDSALWMIPRLCFDVVAALADTGEGAFESWRSEDEFSFRRRGDEVEIEGLYIDPERFPARPWMAAMLAAGRRYVDLIERLWPEDAAEDLPMLRERAQAAETALAAMS